MSLFRNEVNDAVARAHGRGESFNDIMADIATVLGCLVAAGSQERDTRLAFVKASMGVVAEVIDKDLN